MASDSDSCSRTANLKGESVEKIWVKVILDLRIVHDFIYENSVDDNFFEVVRQICERMDTPTPLVLNTHKSYYKAFNQCKFKKSDFIETVYFDELVLESASE